jgi:RES domain-containing protein
MDAWRIDFAFNPRAKSFSGYGSAAYGGRWNPPGTRVVYAADSLALAAMEKFVHLGDEGRSLDFVYYRIGMSSSVRIDERKYHELPRNWRENPAPRSTMDLGSKWVRDSRTAVLRLPSVAIEAGADLLLNPLHSDFKKLAISGPFPFAFDPRTRKK